MEENLKLPLIRHGMVVLLGKKMLNGKTIASPHVRLRASVWWPNKRCMMVEEHDNMLNVSAI
jgi:hypothetical protein